MGVGFLPEVLCHLTSLDRELCQVTIGLDLKLSSDRTEGLVQSPDGIHCQLPPEREGSIVLVIWHAEGRQGHRCTLQFFVTLWV
jgi:hypothetical protein